MLPGYTEKEHSFGPGFPFRRMLFHLSVMQANRKSRLVFPGAAISSGTHPAYGRLLSALHR